MTIAHLLFTYTQTVGLIVIPKFRPLSLSALTVIEVANRSLGEPRYAVSVLPEGRRPVPTSFDVGGR